MPEEPFAPGIERSTPVNRRQFIQGSVFAGLAGAVPAHCCDDGAADAEPALPAAPGRLKITGLKVFGVTWDSTSDRPFVFVKVETDAGVIGWGEATLEGKAGAVLATVQDLRDYILGQDPMKVEHHWQAMYVQSFYRAGPVLGSAI